MKLSIFTNMAEKEGNRLHDSLVFILIDGN